MGIFKVALAIASILAANVSAQSTSTAPTTSSPASSQPTVDLGYAVHRATVNDSGRYYEFSNIRYAEPPVGNLRFAAPVSPITVNRTVNDGATPLICPQGTSLWNVIQALNIYGNVPLANLTTLYQTLANLSSSPPSNVTAEPLLSQIPPSTGQSEDCLALDIVVPQSVYNSEAARRMRLANADKVSYASRKNPYGAPVIVWIFGGAFITGDKAAGRTTKGGSLVARSQENGNSGAIYIGINYRVGIYGFLSGATLQANGTANAGLHDQRLALEWIQKNIHLFGGDPDKVTIFGGSSGGASVLHQITAYGGKKGRVPFSQALTASPGFVPTGSVSQQEATMQRTFQFATIIARRPISTVQQLRTLNFTELYLTNAALTGSAPYGTFGVGPVVDGDFVPALPGQLLKQGFYDTSINVMTSHLTNEGRLFDNPFVQTEEQFAAYLSIVFPTMTSRNVEYITKTLYPPVYNGSYPYTNFTERGQLFVSEFAFTCNSRYLNAAFANSSYAYYFTVPPAWHGSDGPYVFYGQAGQPSVSAGTPVNATLAVALQRYILSFAMTGDPNRAYQGLPYFPTYQENATVLNVNLTGFGQTLVDPTANSRCDFWQQGLFY